MNKTLGEYAKSQEKLRKFKLECNNNEPLNDMILRVQKFSLSQKTRSYLIKVATENADHLYRKVYDIIKHLPKSLQKEWLKKKIFELNEQLNNEVSPRPEFEQDFLEGTFIDYFVLQQTRYEDDAYRYDFNIDYLIPLKEIPKNLDYLLPPTTVYNAHICSTDAYNGETDIESIAEKKGLNHIAYQGNETIEKTFPKFGVITDMIGDLIHYEAMLSSYKEMERGGEMSPPLYQLQSKLKETQLGILYDLLVINGFIAANGKSNFIWSFGGSKVKPDHWKPIIWIKMNSTTKGTMTSKMSLLNLLSLLGFHYKIITDKPLLNRLFAYPDGTSVKFTNSNYTNDEYISEYNDVLIGIVNTIK